MNDKERKYISEQLDMRDARLEELERQVAGLQKVLAKHITAHAMQGTDTDIYQTGTAEGDAKAK